jgi:peptidoglycan/LPS O-acetylase OafA/YrhL
LRCLPEFLVGVLIYRIYDRGLFAWLLATDLALGLVLTTVCALVHNAASDLAIALLFPGLILAAVRNEGHLGRLLNASLRWLGDVPYSLYLVLYLVHLFVLFALVQTVRRLPGLSLRQLPPRASLLAALSLIALSIALASVTYRVIEVPGRQWLRRRLTVGRPPPATDRAAPRRGIGAGAVALARGSPPRPTAD